MVSITGLEFAFSQAPPKMKGVIMACYLLTTALGNAIVVVIAEVRFFHDVAWEFIFFAGLMFATTIVFLIITRNYVEKTHIYRGEVAQSR